MKSWLIGKDSDARRDWGQEEKGTTEDEMAGWHHWLDGRESVWTPGVGDGQGGMACCDSWGCKESDTTELLNWTDCLFFVVAIVMVALIYACLSEIRCYFGYTVLVAANSLQLCLALCDPIDGSPLGFPILGILQARTLEWVAISFPNAWKWKAKVKSLSRVRLFTTPWTADYQAPPPMGFSSQEYWSGLPLAGKLYSMGLHLGIIKIEKNKKQKTKQWKASVIKNVYFSCGFRNCGDKHSVNLCSHGDQYKMAWDYLILSSEVLSLEVNHVRIPRWLLKKRSLFFGTCWSIINCCSQ